jgi:predicted DsbA family dithiol-disulfide isomerase
VGKKRLEKAIEQFKKEHDTKFNIRWRPFLLNTSIPKQGLNRERYFRDKFGIQDYSSSPIAQRLIEAGREDGINFNLTKPEVVSYTVDAHRLLNVALKQRPEVQDQISNELFSKYFEQGVDIGKDNVLLDIAKEYGIDLPKGFFQSDDEVDEIINEDQTAKEQGISGVPFFIFNTRSNPQRYAVSGAQSPAVFLQLLRKLVRK